jgi:hypothetical protein
MELIVSRFEMIVMEMKGSRVKGEDGANLTRAHGTGDILSLTLRSYCLLPCIDVEIEQDEMRHVARKPSLVMILRNIVSVL